MAPIVMEGWTDFFVAEVGASAALTGLVVVAISINLSRILSRPELPGRAAEALITLAGALAVTSIGLIPRQPPAAFGGETLAVGVIIFFTPLLIRRRSIHGIDEQVWVRKYSRVAMTGLTGLPIIVAGVQLIQGNGAGLYWIAAGVILSLIAGVVNAWVLLVEILR